MINSLVSKIQVVPKNTKIMYDMPNKVRSLTKQTLKLMVQNSKLKAMREIKSEIQGKSEQIITMGIDSVFKWHSFYGSRPIAESAS